MQQSIVLTTRTQMKLSIQYHRILSIFLFTAFSSLTLGCSGPTDPPSPDIGMGMDMDMGLDQKLQDDVPYLNILNTRAEFELLAENNLLSVKYIANLKGETHPAPLVEDCYFVNASIYPWHYQFLASFPEYSEVDLRTYSRWVLYRSQRRFYGGDFQFWPEAIHPKTQKKGVYSFLVYGARGHLNGNDIETVYTYLNTCAPLAKDRLVFIPWEQHQKAWLNAYKDILDNKEIPYLFPRDLIGDAPVIYSAGEGYGTLRIIPEGERLEEYGPLDIIITESAPNDISVVQGLITQDPQNELSHTNLRLREKKTPNISSLGIYKFPGLDTFKDKLIHLVAKDGTFTIELALLSDAKTFWDKQRPPVPDPKSDLNIKAFKSFEVLKNSDAIAFGAKASNLGELYTILPPENRNEGFGIPFSAYADAIQASDIQKDIETMLDDERTKTDAAFKDDALKSIRKKIKKITIPEVFLKRVEQKIIETFGPSGRYQRIRFRSSTNVEDLDEITGAGLYSSKSGCIADDFDGDEIGPSLCLSTEEKQQKEKLLKKAKADLLAHPERVYLKDTIDDLSGDLLDEKPVENAIRKVWASLWNKRAFDERSYYRIDHRKAFMGLAVNRSFVLEKTNAVALTELKIDEGRPLYRLNSQIGEESVVRPENPNASAELLSYRRAETTPIVRDIKVLVYSSLVQKDTQIWSEAQLEEIAELLYLAHQHFALNVYSHLTNFSLDVEIKLTSKGKIVFKQARPFVSEF